MTQPIQFECQDSIGYLTLNRPDKYNAFDREMTSAFEAFLEHRRTDRNCRVIIMDGGTAKGFCAGLDVNSYGPEIFSIAPEKAYSQQARLSRMFLKMRQIPQPLICCVHGAAAGIGFSLPWHRISGFYQKMPDSVPPISTSVLAEQTCPLHTFCPGLSEPAGPMNSYTPATGWMHRPPWTWDLHHALHPDNP